MKSIYQITERGRDSICPICGKQFTIWDREAWSYKKRVSVKNGKDKMVYVHTWTCLLRMEERIKNKDLEFLRGYKQ